MALDPRIRAALRDLRYNRYSSVRRAASAHSISHATLARRYKGGQNAFNGQVANQLLTAAEETQLVQWRTELIGRNVPARVNMINSMAGTILRAQQPSSTAQVGTRWYRGFLKQNPKLTTKLSRNLDRARPTVFTRPLLHDWFNLFCTTKEHHRITLSRVYHMDETGIAMGVSGHSVKADPQ